MSTRYEYTAIDGGGNRLTGFLTAETRAVAVESLERQGLVPVAVREPQVSNRGRGGLRQRSLSAEDLRVAFLQLSTMLRSGVPLLDAVSSLAGSTHHPVLEAAFRRITEGLRRGEQFSEALAQTGLPLPRYFHQLARAGEATGQLAQTLSSAVEQIKYEARIASDVRGALVYPTVLILTGIAAVGLIFAFVVPKFANLVERGGGDLPVLASAVIGTGLFARENALWILGIVLVSLVGVVRVFRSARFRDQALAVVAGFPLVGRWLTELETARWASVLAALLGCRVKLDEALGLAAESVRLPSWRNQLERVKGEVKAGATLSASMYEAGLLAATGQSLVQVGERAGELPAMLAALAELYDDAARTRMTRFLQLVEPAAIILIGAVVGVIVLGIVLAITSANQIVI